MKRPDQFQRHLCRPVILLAAAAGLTLPLALQAKDPADAGAQRRFASSEEAIKTLRAAVAAGDRAAVHEIFGPDVTNMMTGDEVQDQANFKGFSHAMSQACMPIPEGDNRIILDLGTNDWPFPVPLVKAKGHWFFDTDAGQEEVINRHIGGDELHAIGICRAYVTAQKQYFSQERDGSGVRKYAQKLKSTPGQHDGLYWESTSEPSPFGALVAEAHAEGYGHHPAGTGPHPFHGYLFRILTGQGRGAPGGKASYLVNGNLTAGFALVAYPDKWGKSGIMTFIVNQDGKVYQRNFGEKTGELAESMSEYSPGRHWTLVEEPGFPEP